MYTARALREEKPTDLPFVQAGTSVLAINLTTAEALGLATPPPMPAQADEVVP